MSSRHTSSMSRSARLQAFAALAALAALSCAKTSEKPTPAATVQHAVTEAQLTTVTLTADAVRRLGIETAAVESTTALPTRTIGGEMVVPPGQSLTVAAPVAGTILPPDGGAVPRAGSRVASQQPLMRLVALPPDRGIGRVEQDLAVAEAQLRQAQAEADRVAKLYAERLVSTREHERVQAELVAARSAHDAAAAQRNLVRNAATADVRGLTPLLITAPDAGVIRALHVAAGQAVAAGAPLAELIRVDRLWVRVPVYAGDASRFARSAEAVVHGLAGAQSGPTFRATPVAAPPSADPAAASVDLYYEVRGAGTVLRPGERVGLTIPLAASAERALVVPLASIVRDMSGGSWVYERIDSLTFARRRVEVARVVDRRAVLALGPGPGTPVVTAGAAELFGTEFGAGK